MQRFATVALVLVLVAADLRADLVDKPPTGVAARRTGWFYATGAIRKVATGRWEEKNARESFTYEEMDRNAHYVELYDRARRQSFRLYNWGVYVWGKKAEKWHLVRPGRWDDPVKKPLDPALNSTERTHLETASERQSFPKLGNDFEVLAPASPTYNCIAWALGKNDRWVWPSGEGRPVGTADFDALFAWYGYRRAGSLNYDRVAGYEKVVLYARANEWGVLEPTHSARQLPDGSWSSKLGKLPLIRHLHPDDLDGGTYGQAHAVYLREKK